MSLITSVPIVAYYRLDSNVRIGYMPIINSRPSCSTLLEGLNDLCSLRRMQVNKVTKIRA